MSLYKAFYDGFNGASAALQLFSFSPQPTNLADIVQNDRVKNPAVVYDPKKIFNEADFRHKIQTHLEEQSEKNKRSI